MYNMLKIEFQNPPRLRPPHGGPNREHAICDDIASYFFLEKQGFHARGVTDGPSRRLRVGHGRSRAGDRKPLPNGPANPIAAAWLLQFRNKTSEITV